MRGGLRHDMIMLCDDAQQGNCHLLQVDAAAARPIMELVGSAEREELMVKGGHVSVVAGPGAVTRLWPTLDKWLAKRSV